MFKNLGSHWYDRLWDRLETAAEDVDESTFAALLDMRKAFAKAETDDESLAARVRFEDWEAVNA